MVPLLSRFYGIEIRVRWDDHPPPHIHVYYGEHRASVSVETLDVIEGKLPRRVRALVLEWALQHRVELRRAWSAVDRHEVPGRIEPLR